MISGSIPAEPDLLLGGRVRLFQPAVGYRAAIDPVFLAAAVSVRAGARVLDAGAGTGAVGLCLAVRRPDLTITGVELLADHAALFSLSAEATGVADRVRAVVGDLRHGSGQFDAVITNPPFYPGGTPSPHPDKRTAHREAGDLPLGDWCRLCLDRLPHKGRLFIIHRADRLDALLAALHGRAGDARILPLWPRAGTAATRVIVAARKGVRTGATLLPGLTLHQADSGAYTPEAEAVLRHGAGLDMGLITG